MLVIILQNHLGHISDYVQPHDLRAQRESVSSIQMEGYAFVMLSLYSGQWNVVLYLSKGKLELQEHPRTSKIQINTLCSAKGSINGWDSGTGSRPNALIILTWRRCVHDLLGICTEIVYLLTYSGERGDVVFSLMFNLFLKLV